MSILEQLFEKNEKYYFASTCVDFEDGNDVQQITGWGEPEGDEYVITPDEFYNKTNANRAESNVDDEYGYNPHDDVYWRYDVDEDIHYFYTKSGRI